MTGTLLQTAQHNLNGVYLWANYYDIVFNRDTHRQIRFCQDIYDRFTGQPLRSALDIACGPGYFAQGFARQGIRAVGLDLSHEMLAFARHLSAQQGLTIDFIEADMRDVHLAEPVDMAICMFDAIDLLIEDQGAIDHFRTVRDNLTPGGLYLIEQTHPRRSTMFNVGQFSWCGERDGVEVEFVWGANYPVNDLVTATAEIHMEMRVNDHGTFSVIHDQSVERSRSLQEIRLLAEYVVGGWKAVAYFGDFDPATPLDWSPESVNMITIFQKQ